MANRNFTNQQFTMEKAVVSVFAKVTFGATGAPTLVAANSKGVQSVTRNSAGNYTFVFGTNSGSNQQKDTYAKLLAVKHTTVNATAPAAPALYVTADNSATASASVTVQFNSAGTATDPGSGEAAIFEFIFCNSTAF